MASSNWMPPMVSLLRALTQIAFTIVMLLIPSLMGLPWPILATKVFTAWQWDECGLSDRAAHQQSIVTVG